MTTLTIASGVESTDFSRAFPVHKCPTKVGTLNTCNGREIFE
jgi:hypothetical protein